MSAHRSRAAVSARPRGCATIWLIRLSVTGVTLPSSSLPSSSRLPCSGSDGLASAARRSGLAETTRPNRNSPSSRSSRPSFASAARTSASTASCSIASDRSPEVAQWPSAAAATRASARPVIFPCNSAATTAPFSAAGLPGSDSARRSPCSVSSSPTTANSSLASLVATVALVMCSADNRSDRSANEALLTPRMRIAFCANFRAYFGFLCRTSRASRAGHLLELVEEPVDHPVLPDRVFERLAHDLARQLGGQRPDLGAQRVQRLLAFGLDLGLRGLGHPARQGLGLLLRLIGAGQAAFDRLGAVGQRLGDAGQRHPSQEAEHQEEQDRADDELGPRGEQRVRRRRAAVSEGDHHALFLDRLSCT